MRNTLRKLLSFLLVLTLILGSGYANYGVEKNTSIHLKTEDFNVQDVEAVYVIITGEHGNLQSGIIDYVLINYDLSTSDPEIATKIKMTANGGVTQFTAPDFSLSANSRILYFEIYKVKYYVGQHISLVGKEGGPELDSAGGTVNYEITCIPTYNNVYYNGNGNTTGTVPIDNLNYYQYDEVTVKSKK